MKKVLFLLTFLLILPSQVLAVSPSPSASGSALPTSKNTPAKEDLIKQIDELKNKVASKVAELKLVEKRGVVGTVTAVTDTQITLNDVQGNTRFVDVDELTKFSSEDKAGFGISDVEKGMTLGALGLYNKESRRLLARFIDVMDLPKTLNGVVTDKSVTDYTLTVTTETNTQIVVDIENLTKTYEFSTTGDLLKAGFVKLAVGQNVVVVGFPNAKIKDRLTGSRIVIFPGVPKNPKITVTPAPSPSASASAKSTANPSSTP